MRNVPIYFQWISRISFFSYASGARRTGCLTTPPGPASAPLSCQWCTWCVQAGRPCLLALPASDASSQLRRCVCLPSADVLVQNEFGGLFFVDPTTGQQVPAEPFIPPAMATGLSLGGNMGILGVMLVGTRLLAWLFLEGAAKFNYL